MSIESQHYDNAKAFLEALNLTSETWLPRGEFQSPWCFRGQGDASWSLVPKAWRTLDAGEFPIPRIKRLLEPVLDETTRPKWKFDGASEAIEREFALQVAAEADVVFQFAHRANNIGLGLPDGEPITGQDFLRAGFRIPRWNSAPSKVPDIVALAQHHGIPTRLLDFTLNPLIAAFFAAEGVPDCASELAVWAINHSELLHSALRVKGVRREKNLYIRAQNGLFLFHTGANRHFIENGAWPRFEDSVPPNAIRKLTMPADQAPELLRFLCVCGVSRDQLMPTLDHVASSVLDRWRLYAAVGEFRQRTGFYDESRSPRDERQADGSNEREHA